MNRIDLVKSLSTKFELTNVKADEIIKYMLDEIRLSLAKKEQVVFVGFGSFSVRERAARNGRNPRTGEQIKIKSSKTIHFSVGKELKESINK